jgi:hypothetical protein
MADENIPNENEELQSIRSRRDYLEALMYALVGFGLGVVLIVLFPQGSELSLSDALRGHSETGIAGILFWIALRFGRPGGVVLCLLSLAFGVWVWKSRSNKGDTKP